MVTRVAHITIPFVQVEGCETNENGLIGFPFPKEGAEASTKKALVDVARIEGVNVVRPSPPACRRAVDWGVGREGGSTGHENGLHLVALTQRIFRGRLQPWEKGNGRRKALPC